MYGLPTNVASYNNINKGRELKNDERTSITSGDGVSCLLLQNITTDDSGKYDITVENVHGEDCSYASLAVEGPPDPPSGTPCITTTLDSVTVAWSSSPYDGGKIINGYAVECSMVGSDIWTIAVDECHSLSYVVRGLQPGGRYVFRVRALNVHGYSRPSVESEVVQLEEQNECSYFEARIVSVEPGPEFKARYEVLEELGKGRFGVVHKVVDKESNQKLAAKFIKCRTSKDRDKVQDEIDIMNLLRHQKLLQLAAAFENPRDMIMVMEYISGGELFERVVADDFTLTEKDCILFMRQICEGVAYMHTQDIVHLDLKPENIMCHTRTSHEIKIIDFGLAQKLIPNEPVRVLFGTPEFIPPEIIGYEPIGIESDMWSIGVICYVLLSGLSPFMGDNDSETFANITRADFDFEDEAFNTVSQNARDFIGALLIKRKEDRLSAEQCLKHVWLDPETHQETVVLSTDKLKKFIIRRKWQKTGNAIRALGRMATLSASRRNSANSSPNTPRPSLSGVSSPSVGRMSSVNEEDSFRSPNSLPLNTSDVEQQDTDVTDDSIEDIIEETAKKTNGVVKDVDNDSCKEEIEEKSIGDEEDESITQIKETYEKISRRLNELEDKCNDLIDTQSPIDNYRLLENGTCFKNKLNAFKKIEEPVDKPDSLKSVKEIRNGKEIRTRACSERSDSGISDCSTLFTSTTSTPLLSKKFCIDEENEEKIFDTSATLYFKNHRNSFRCSKASSIENSEEEICKEQSDEVDWKTNNKGGKYKLSEKIDRFTKGKPSTTTSSLKKTPIYTYRAVDGIIKKFDTTDTTKLTVTIPTIETTPNRFKTSSKQEKSSNLPIGTTKNGHSSRSNDSFNSSLNAPSVTRYRSPSPSLLRKTQAVIAKEQSNEFYMAKQALLKTPQEAKRSGTRIPSKSSSFNSKDKPKSESFRKAAAFWNSPLN